MIIECVPNFSEGRRKPVVEAIAQEITAVTGVRLLDAQMDADHNRSVVTFIGDRVAVGEAAFLAAKRAVQEIDLRAHQGTHPRMGALDVLPFVPIRDVRMEECVELAREVGRRIGEELRVPVFLYEAAATRPDRRNLADIRKPQFEGLAELIGKDPERVPDFGPNAIHPSAGCMAVGARPPLIAYNIDLDTDNEKVAKAIAKKIRERDGGLPAIKALGMYIQDRRCAQVSINVCDYTRTSLKTVFDAVVREAQVLGAGVRSSEVVGLCPQSALPDEWRAALKLAGFKDEQIIERRLGDTKA
ncbi:MAG: glutamate formimidoyltransferase [Planctomycetes bacterium]|nr:glutamate formimidoyltransferase [Planctomycetota bacterium]